MMVFYPGKNRGFSISMFNGTEKNIGMWCYPVVTLKKKTILFCARNLAFESKNCKKTLNQTKLETKHAFSKDISGECPPYSNCLEPYPLGTGELSFGSLEKTSGSHTYRLSSCTTLWWSFSFWIIASISGSVADDFGAWEIIWMPSFWIQWTSERTIPFGSLVFNLKGSWCITRRTAWWSGKNYWHLLAEPPRNFKHNSSRPTSHG